MSSRRARKVEREARFEAARGVLVGGLADARREDGWFSAPAVQGRFEGRDVEVSFPGGFATRRVQVLARVRTGGGFEARARSRLLAWITRRPMKLRGAAPPEGVPFALERLVRDFGAVRVVAGDGAVVAHLRWNPDRPDAPRLLKVIERLHRIALALEGVSAPRVEARGVLGCPFCRESIGEDEAIARCDSCGTPYHPSCFEENRGCAIYGCRNRAARTTSARLRPEPKSPSP